MRFRRRVFLLPFSFGGGSGYGKKRERDSPCIFAHFQLSFSHQASIGEIHSPPKSNVIPPPLKAEGGGKGEEEEEEEGETARMSTRQRNHSQKKEGTQRHVSATATKI